jgi:hypothetical protein
VGRGGRGVGVWEVDGAVVWGAALELLWRRAGAIMDGGVDNPGELRQC